MFRNKPFKFREIPPLRRLHRIGTRIRESGRRSGGSLKCRALQDAARAQIGKRQAQGRGAAASGQDIVPPRQAHLPLRVEVRAVAK